MPSPTTHFMTLENVTMFENAGMNSTVRQTARIPCFSDVTSKLVLGIDGWFIVTEVGRLPYRWPADTDFALLELDVLDRDCPACGRLMYICDHRYRRFHTLDGPVELV